MAAFSLAAAALAFWGPRLRPSQLAALRRPGGTGASETHSRRDGLFMAIAFFAGIVINLTILGALVSCLGGILTESFGRYWALGMAVFSLAAAVLAFWGSRLRPSQLAALRRPGMTGAFIYGFVFSLGTSAAPLLVLLAIAASQGGTIYGVFLVLALLGYTSLWLAIAADTGATLLVIANALRLLRRNDS